MTTDLINYFFKYAITKNNLNLKSYKLDIFIYIILEKYILDKYYKIIINIRAFK